MGGRFITFEGGEGTGKSTHAAMLGARLRSFGVRTQLTRELLAEREGLHHKNLSSAGRFEQHQKQQPDGSRAQYDDTLTRHKRAFFKRVEHAGQRFSERRAIGRDIAADPMKRSGGS